MTTESVQTVTEAFDGHVQPIQTALSKPHTLGK